VSNPFQRDDLHLEEETHTYYLGDQPCTSVTQVVKSFKRPFKADEIAERCAVRDGMTKEAVLAQWEHKRDRAARIGTRAHLEIERYLNGCREIDLAILVRLHQMSRFDYTVKAPWTKHFEAFLKYSQAHLLCSRVWPEVQIVDSELLLAGTVDVIGESADGLEIVDWKTSEKIEMTGYGKKLYAPLNKMDDCNFHVYRMQLNTYAHILETAYQQTVKHLSLVHLKGDGTFETYDIPRNEDITAKMLKKWRSKRDKGRIQS